jgi:CDP-glycerol glycerophosphotransferase (TagB/SpsB family)
MSSAVITEGQVRGEVRRAIRYLFGTHPVERKIAFWVNEEYIYDHYKNILLRLDPSKVVLVLGDKFRSSKYVFFRNEIESNGWQHVYFEDVLDLRRYAYLVTHLAFGDGRLRSPSFAARLRDVTLAFANRVITRCGGPAVQIPPKQYFQLRLGIKNFRFMYGPDLNDRLWNSNNVYDLFFCHGPTDAEEMARLYGKPTIIMGYPRYDQFFSQPVARSKQSTLNAFPSWSPARKTILWITTESKYFSTVETYAPGLEELANRYNVILRPHPLEIDAKSLRFKWRVREIVDSKAFIPSTDAFQTLSDLYSLADVVLTDYGGAIFGAVYLDKRVLLLNHPRAKDDIGIVESNSMDARNYLPCVDPENVHMIEDCIFDDEFWEKFRPSQEAFRLKYFGEIRGGSAKIVADYLATLDFHRAQ